MTKKIWKLNLKDGIHEIELRHSSFSGKRSILVDGVRIEIPRQEKRKRWDTGSKHIFSVHAHQCMMVIRSSGFNYEYELFLDGTSIDSGLPLTHEDPIEVTPEAIRTRRIGVVVISSIAGLVCIWINLRTLRTNGFYSPELAMLGPAVLVIAGYYALFPDDPWEIPKPFPIRLAVMLILAFALGLANWYAIENGLYWAFLGSG